MKRKAADEGAADEDRTRMAKFDPQRWAVFGRFSRIGKAHWWPALEKCMNDEGASPYESPYKPEPRQAIIHGLQAAMRRIRDLRSTFTWVEQSPDRIFLPAYPRNPFYWMTLGGPARVRGIPLPYNAVSYENTDPQIARWVLRSGFDNLAVAFYSFHDKPQVIAVRPWILDHGVYEVSEGVDADGDFHIDKGVTWQGHPAPEHGRDARATRRLTLRRWDTPVELTLPPRAVYVMEATLQKRLPDCYDRADPAISSKDLEYLRFIPALRIRVHNIGRKAAENVEIVLTDADTGKLLWKSTIPRIGWPADLAPKTVALFTGRLDLGQSKRLRLTLDPEAKIEDLTRHNNSITIKR